MRAVAATVSTPIFRPTLSVAPSTSLQRERGFAADFYENLVGQKGEKEIEEGRNWACVRACRIPNYAKWKGGKGP